MVGQPLSRLLPGRVIFQVSREVLDPHFKETETIPKVFNTTCSLFINPSQYKDTGVPHLYLLRSDALTKQHPHDIVIITVFL